MNYSKRKIKKVAEIHNTHLKCYNFSPYQCNKRAYHATELPEKCIISISKQLFIYCVRSVLNIAVSLLKTSPDLIQRIYGNSKEQTKSENIFIPKCHSLTYTSSLLLVDNTCTLGSDFSDKDTNSVTISRVLVW